MMRKYFISHLIVVGLFIGSFGALLGTSVATAQGRDPGDKPDKFNGTKPTLPCKCSAALVEKNLRLLGISAPGVELQCNETRCIDRRPVTCVGNENVGWASHQC